MQPPPSVLKEVAAWSEIPGVALGQVCNGWFLHQCTHVYTRMHLAHTHRRFPKQAGGPGRLFGCSQWAARVCYKPQGHRKQK